MVILQLLILVLSNPSVSSGPVIADEVKDYLDLGINIMAIGVGSDRGEKLSDIATDNNYAIRLKNFRELSSRGATKIGDALLPGPGTFRAGNVLIVRPKLSNSYTFTLFGHPKLSKL